MPTKVHLVKTMVFPVLVCRCESWTINKAERRRIDASELRFWRRLLRVPWTARRSNQSILKEISPEYSLEGLMLKLKLLYLDHLMQRTNSFEIDPVAGKDWGLEEKRTTEDEMVAWRHQLNGHEFEQMLEIMMDREAWHAAVRGVAKNWTWLIYWTTTEDHLSVLV